MIGALEGYYSSQVVYRIPGVAVGSERQIELQGSLQQNLRTLKRQSKNKSPCNSFYSVFTRNGCY